METGGGSNSTVLLQFSWSTSQRLQCRLRRTRLWTMLSRTARQAIRANGKCHAPTQASKRFENPNIIKSREIRKIPSHVIWTQCQKPINVDLTYDPTADVIWKTNPKNTKLKGVQPVSYTFKAEMDYPTVRLKEKSQKYDDNFPMGIPNGGKCFTLQMKSQTCDAAETATILSLLNDISSHSLQWNARGHHHVTLLATQE